MLIDWFTVFAQIINFLILVFLLHRFLYKPITKTIKARQAEIEKRWQDAENEKNSAQKEADSYQKKQHELEQKEQNIIAKAEEKADQKYHNLLEEAHQEVEQKRQSWEDSLQQDREQFFDNFKEKITQQVYQMIRHILSDLADISLEQQMINRFIERLENLGEEDRKILQESLQKIEDNLIIYSRFEIPSDSRERILNTLHQMNLYQGNKVQFIIESNLLGGIELQASNYKIAWTLKNYLQNLDKDLNF